MSKQGYVYAFAAAALWAAAGTSAKLLFNVGLSPDELVALRLWIAAGVFVVVLASTGRRHFAIGWSSARALLVLALINIGMQFTYFTALKYTNVATAIFLQYLAPVLVALWGALTREEPFTRRTAMAVSLTTLGIFLLATGGSLRHLAISREGLISGLSSAGFFAAHTVYSRRKLASTHPMTVLAYVLVMAALLWSFYRPLWRLVPAWALPGPALIMAGIGVFGTVLPFWFFLRSLGLLPATHTITTSTAEPLLGMVFAYFLLGETMRPMHLGGGLLILAAIGILAGGKRRAQQDRVQPAGRAYDPAAGP
jgi:drug/metabolite transporter (DMT)-like permease